MTLQQALELALEHHQAGRIEQAASIYRQVLSRQPNNPDALHLLGMVYYTSGDLGAASELIQRAVKLRPTVAEYRNNLGLVFAGQQLYDRAEAEYRVAVKLKPDYFDAYYGLGIALYHQSRFDQAVEAYDKAMALDPNSADVHNNLANALRDQGKIRQAVVHYECAAKLDTNDVEILANLGSALPAAGEFDKAIDVLRRAVDLRPDHAASFVHLGNALKDEALLAEAIECYRKAVSLAPSNAAFHDNLVYALHYLECDPNTIFQEHRRWNQQHAVPLSPLIRPHSNDRTPDRRLRIGYVSPDFREHSVSRFVLPLLENHDHINFQTFTYACVRKPDSMTWRMQSQVDEWRDVFATSDEALAELIRRDQIDILVDLAGHTDGNRLLVFARKPAPIQVNWQGYPDTTGLDAIDYRIVDGFSDPIGLTDAFASEKLIRLPRTNWCYQELHAPPQETRPDRPITFGCFNNFAKVTAEMLHLWAQILRAMPESQLVLKGAALSSRRPFERVLQIFDSMGIEQSRLILRGWEPSHVEHLAVYNQIDIALDTFPYHGTTTTFEALSMGVPVITLAGRTHVSRVGVSLLNQVGLPDLVADSTEQYVNIAQNLADDPARLSDYRATLRDRLASSPLSDGKAFAQDMESAYRQMWRQWCAGR